MNDTLSITITRPDDWHLHLRDEKSLNTLVAHTAKQFARAIVMPNLKPPVVNVDLALAYQARILAARDNSQLSGFAAQFMPLMTLYLTDSTTPTDIYQAKASGGVYGVKLYPAGATTNSESGVTDLLARCAPTLAALEECGIPLLVHGEVTDNNIDIFDREKIFIDRVMIPLRKAFPALKIVFEHITTLDAVQYVTQADGCIGATITAHHLLYNRNALFVGGMRPHWYCLPVLKREPHRLALLEAATSQNPRFFLGTDSAPHAQQDKESACGCAGCYTAYHAMELYATAFDQVGKIHALETFASFNGADFYGLARNQSTLTLVKKPFTIPLTLDYQGQSLIPLAAGQTLDWQVQH